jgi:hypothetical protein
MTRTFTTSATGGFQVSSVLLFRDYNPTVGKFLNTGFSVNGIGQTNTTYNRASVTGGYDQSYNVHGGNLPPGNHTITLNVWDDNNTGNFKVLNGEMTIITGLNFMN